MQKVRRHNYIIINTIYCSDCLLAMNFKIYFTPFIRVLFIFPLRYLFSIGHKKLLDLEGGPPIFNQINSPIYST